MIIKKILLFAIAVCFSASLAQASTPIHRYSFAETGGSTFADSIGGSSWTATLPSGGTLANGQLALSGSNQYGSLPAGIVSSLSNFTISAWVKLNSTANWTRLFDFGNSTTVYMFLAPQNGSNGRVRYAITTSGSGGEQQITGTSGLSAGVWHHLAVTLNGTTGVLYVDGSPVGTNANMALQPRSLGVTTKNYLGKSQWSDPYLNGSIGEFSIYDVALSSGEIFNTYASEASQFRTLTFDATTTYQTIEGLGGALAFYQGWLVAHPYKQEIYSNAFAGLNLSMLRLGNWFRYTGDDKDAADIVSNATRILRRPVPVFMSSWAPPAFLKSNGQVGNGGTIIKTNGAFAYAEFANYWYDSLQSYRSNGVIPTWISIQNEPDFTAGYDSCVFHPTEDTVNGTNYASYPKALAAVFQRLNALPSPPKLLAPEVVGLGYNAVQNYASKMDANTFYGVAHHLYGGSTDGTPDGYIGTLSALTNVFPTKPRFMTEFGVTNMIEQANLIHNTMTYEQASGYNYWSLVWPGTEGGLIQIENPWHSTPWTNAPVGTPTQSHGWWITPAYWAMKHFSYFIEPGFKRVGAISTDANILASAYISPNKQRLVAVFINRSKTLPATIPLNFGSFAYDLSSVYQTAGADHFKSLGAVAASQVTLPAESLTTVVFDKQGALVASNPTPADGATGIVRNPSLSWTPDINAVSHAVYFGASSNAVANATPASPEFRGLIGTNILAVAAPSFGAAYYWRVDEVGYANTNRGAVWSFTTKTPVPLPSPLLSQDIGSVGIPGGAEYNNGVFEVTGAGADIQGAADAFNFTYMAVKGDFTMIARVASVQAVDGWSKAGLMVRESLAVNAVNAFIALTPSNGVTWQCRPSTGAATSYNNTTNFFAPYWLKMVRSGDTFTAYRSPDGNVWRLQGLATLKLATNVLIGLAVTSHNNASLCTAKFDTVTAPDWPMIPDAPGALTAIAGDTQVALSWETSTGATSYNVKRATVDAGLFSTITNVTTTNFTDTGLKNGTPYYYVVSGVSSAGEGVNSLQVSATPQLVATLSISLANTNVTLSWPSSVTGFNLIVRTNLSLGNWLEVTSPAPQLISNQWQITVPASGETEFFQLRH